MKTVRNIALAIAAGSVLAVGASAYAQDANKPEAQAKEQKHEHRMQMRGKHAMHQGGMQQGGMHQGGMQHAGMKHDCPEEARRVPPTPEHNHQ